MIRVFRVLCCLLALTPVLASCGGAGSAPTALSLAAPPGQPYTGPASLAAFSWGKPLVSKLNYVGPPSGAGLSAVVLLKMGNPAGLLAYAQQANDPRSPSYRHWLTPQQIANQFGASQQDYATAESYFASFGMRVGGWPQREALTVTGTLAQMQSAFGTSFGTYTFEGKSVIAPTGTPHFTKPVPVVAVTGLIGAPLMHSFYIAGNNAAFYGYSPQQIATAFDYSGAWSAGFNGRGINVGIIGTGPILNAQGTEADIAALGSFWHASLATVTQIAASPQPSSSPNGETGTGATDPNPTGLAVPPPVTAPCNQSQSNFPNYYVCNPEDIEAQLDTESIASLAPGASVLFYLAFNPVECFDASNNTFSAPINGACSSGYTVQQAEGLELNDDELQQAIADNRADVLSMSFGESESGAVEGGYINASGSSPGLGQIEMASLVAEGIAVFASSGDNGAFDCFDGTTGAYTGTPCVEYPASDPNVVAVGGVTLPLDESGNLTGAITAWADNTTLGGGTFGGAAGSGGGVSSVFTANPWQMATTSMTMRELPDISLDANPNTGPSVVVNAGFPEQTTFAVGGTSASAPEAAAQWGIVLQACKASSTCNKGGATGYRLGNPAPYYYAIYGKNNQYATGSYSALAPTLGYSSVFYDVMYGDNQAVPPPGAPTPTQTPTGYAAGPGYDEVTGIGASFTGHLVQAVTGQTVP